MDGRLSSACAWNRSGFRNRRSYYKHTVLGHEGYFKRDLERLVRLVGSGRLDLSRSISHVVSLEDVARGVEQLSKKKDNLVRIVVKPGNR
jgi:threonine dehydrogenase-like Zn-dependent dehydrogenase